jgi:hypothetical protein
MVISVPLVPTVNPETTTVPALLRISALAAVPVAEAVPETPDGLSVRTSPEIVAAGLLSVSEQRTPVDPERADVPITRVPADPEPDAAVIVLLLIVSLTVVRRFVRRVAL